MTDAQLNVAERVRAEMLLGESVGIQRALHLAARFAGTDAPILLRGETGTGKELLARLIHQWSERAGELVDVNCGTLPRELIESTLFGHRKGAYSGAVEDRIGLVQAAHGGTLFLDEVCSLSLEAQVKLLRVLETGEFRRVGDTAKRRSRFRILAASQAPLDDRVASGGFRLDLLQRIAGVVIELPPLRERDDDVVLLAATFAARQDRVFNPVALALLRAHAWPGNVRELQATVLRACWLCHETELTAESVVEALGTGASSAPEGAETGRDERRLLSRLLETHGWDVSAVARALGVNRTTIWRRMWRCGLAARTLKRAWCLEQVGAAARGPARA